MARRAAVSHCRVLITHGATSALFVLVGGQAPNTRRSLTISGGRHCLLLIDDDVINVNPQCRA
jgi:hypothetical protein